MNSGHLCDKLCGHGPNFSISTISKRLRTSRDCPAVSSAMSTIFSWIIWLLASCWFSIVCKSYAFCLIRFVWYRKCLSDYNFVHYMLFCVWYRITSPLILLVIASLMYASYRVRQIQGPVVLFGKLFSVNQLCIALNIAGIPILYLFGAGNIMFWVVGKATISFIRRIYVHYIRN